MYPPNISSNKNMAGFNYKQLNQFADELGMPQAPTTAQTPTPPSNLAGNLMGAGLGAFGSVMKSAAADRYDQRIGMAKPNAAGTVLGDFQLAGMGSQFGLVGAGVGAALDLVKNAFEYKKKKDAYDAQKNKANFQDMRESMMTGMEPDYTYLAKYGTKVYQNGGPVVPEGNPYLKDYAEQGVNYLTNLYNNPVYQRRKAEELQLSQDMGLKFRPEMKQYETMSPTMGAKRLAEQQIQNLGTVELAPQKANEMLMNPYNTRLSNDMDGRLKAMYDVPIYEHARLLVDSDKNKQQILMNPYILGSEYQTNPEFTQQTMIEGLDRASYKRPYKKGKNDYGTESYITPYVKDLVEKNTMYGDPELMQSANPLNVSSQLRSFRNELENFTKDSKQPYYYGKELESDTNDEYFNYLIRNKENKQSVAPALLQSILGEGQSYFGLDAQKKKEVKQRFNNLIKGVASTNDTMDVNMAKYGSKINPYL